MLDLPLSGGLGAHLVSFGLLFFRATALFSVAPIFSARPIPARVRVALALLVSAAASASMPPIDAAAFGADALLPVIARETLLGLVVGGTARAFLEAAQAAGHTLGLSAGLGFGATVDPTNGAPSTAVGEMINLLALAAAVSLGLHRELIAWFCASALEHPPGSFIDSWSLAEHAVRSAIEATALAVRLALPVAAATTCAHVIVGLVSRSVPQMSLGNIGFAIPLLAGGWAFSLGIEDMAAMVARATVEAVRAFSDG